MMTITKTASILILFLVGAAPAIAQDVVKKEKKVIVIKSTEDLAELDKIFVPNEVINRETTATEEEEVLAALAVVYTDAQKEEDALNKEQEQLVDWYFDSPSTLNTTTTTSKIEQKKEVIPSKK